MTRNFSAAEALQACQISQCDGFLAEGEIAFHLAPPNLTDPSVGPILNEQAQNWPELVFYLSQLNIFKGTVTTFAPFQKWIWNEDPNVMRWELLPAPELSAPLINGGWSCHTECYDLTGAPELWIERRDFYATQHLKWPRTQPVAGPFAGRTMNNYPTFDAFANGSVWAAEYLI